MRPYLINAGKRENYLINKGGLWENHWVTCLDVLEHLPNPIKILREIYVLMANNGNLIVTVPNWYDIINSKLLKRNKYHLHAHTLWVRMTMLKKQDLK